MTTEVVYIKYKHYICKMEKEFIPYELALRMKALYSGWVSIPTYLQAFRWFRDNYNLYHNIDKHGYWFFEIKKDEGFGDLTEVISVYDFDRYEEAELHCLIKLIEVVEK
jgi:RimJ/RimL family protein N-acetyltransferase